MSARPRYRQTRLQANGEYDPLLEYPKSSSTAYKVVVALVVVALLVGAIGLVLGAVSLGNLNSHKKNAHGPYVNMDLIVDIPNVMSVDMNKILSKNPYGFNPPDPFAIAGKETVIVFTISTVSIYDKKTSERISGPIDSLDFFPGKTADDFLMGDWWAVYDPHDERIWFVAFSFPSTVYMRVDMCVSKDASPREGSDLYCYKEDVIIPPVGDFPFSD